MFSFNSDFVFRSRRTEANLARSRAACLDGSRERLCRTARGPIGSTTKTTIYVFLQLRSRRDSWPRGANPIRRRRRMQWPLRLSCLIDCASSRPPTGGEKAGWGYEVPKARAEVAGKGPGEGHKPSQAKLATATEAATWPWSLCIPARRDKRCPHASGGVLTS